MKGDIEVLTPILMAELDPEIAKQITQTPLVLGSPAFGIRHPLPACIIDQVYMSWAQYLKTGKAKTATKRSDGSYAVDLYVIYQNSEEERGQYRCLHALGDLVEELATQHGASVEPISVKHKPRSCVKHGAIMIGKISVSGALICGSPQSLLSVGTSPSALADTFIERT